VIAHGPLEANANFFSLAIRAARFVKRSGGLRIPPYHVTLATGLGIKKLFQRFGLQQRFFELREVPHPAPRLLRMKEIADLRKSSLFFLRKISQTISAAAPERLGNRFFYVGIKEQ
jgi:hypothetical protein